MPYAWPKNDHRKRVAITAVQKFKRFTYKSYLHYYRGKSKVKKMTNNFLQHILRQTRSVNASNNEGNTRFLWTSGENLCDFPAFCDESATTECEDIKLNSCNKCQLSKASLFLFVVLTLSLIVLLSNILTLCVGVYRRKRGSRQKVDDVRSSLAVADLLTGIQLVIVVSHNFQWMIHSTSNEVLTKVTTTNGTASAIFPAICNLFTFTSSLYHLLYMGMQRLHAVAWPISYKFQSRVSVYQSLAVVWILAALAASIPVWFSDDFTFSYYSSTMLYWPMLKGDSKTEIRSTAIGLMFFFYIFPFILMTFLTIASAILLRTKLKNSRRLSQSQFHSDDSFRRNQDRSAFKTVTVMQLGFTITIAPLIVVTMLFYADLLNCRSVIVPYFISFYLSMSNSLLNVVIYSVRDKSFRSSIKEMFVSLKNCSMKQTDASTTTSGK